jgi:hypothetical protein
MPVAMFHEKTVWMSGWLCGENAQGLEPLQNNGLKGKGSFAFTRRCTRLHANIRAYAIHEYRE